jgi:hypothetical protein
MYGARLRVGRHAAAALRTARPLAVNRRLWRIRSRRARRRVSHCSAWTEYTRIHRRRVGRHGVGCACRWYANGGANRRRRRGG